MTSLHRPRRSALYLPGNRPHILEKGKSLPADVVILDLEDAVGADDKIDSRARVVEAVGRGDYVPREVVVRVNGLGTAGHDADMSAVAVSGADGVLVPKVESAEQVRALDAALTAAGAPDELKLWVMVETPAAFLHIGAIADASERLEVLVIGTNDLINELHALHVPGRGPISPMLALAVLGARSAGKSILDGVYNAIRDADGFVAEARQGRAMGFDGKTVIHPSQVQAANEIFGPSADDVAYARRVVAAFRQAQADGESVAVLDGQMIEELHVRNAHRTIDMAARIHALARAATDC